MVAATIGQRKLKISTQYMAGNKVLACITEAWQELGGLSVKSHPCYKLAPMHTSLLVESIVAPLFRIRATSRFPTAFYLNPFLLSVYASKTAD